MTWISVEDEMPTKDDFGYYFLVANTLKDDMHPLWSCARFINGEWEMVYSSDDYGLSLPFCSSNYFEYFIPEEITHWMRIPKIGASQ